MELQETYCVTGPQLEILGEVESKLPAPARKRPTALLTLTACVLAAVLGLGGVKMKSRYNKVAQLYYTENDGYSIGYLVEQSANYGANMVTVAKGVLPADDEGLAALKSAVADLEVADTPKEAYAAESRLVSAAKMVYESAAPTLEAADKDKANSFRGQYQEALSAFEQANHMDYNKQARAYNQQAGKFPAWLVGSISGAGRVELFQ